RSVLLRLFLDADHGLCRGRCPSRPQSGRQNPHARSSLPHLDRRLLQHVPHFEVVSYLMVAPVLFALAQFAIHVDADEFANVVFHLNCLGSNIPCTLASFQKFWHDDLHWTPADQRQLEAWRDSLDDISFREPPGEETGFLAMVSAFHPRQMARRRIIATAFDSHSPADFAKRAAKLGSPAEIARLRSALDHFQTRLHLWW